MQRFALGIFCAVMCASAGAVEAAAGGPASQSAGRTFSRENNSAPYLNCTGLRLYPKGTRFKIEAGHRFDSPVDEQEHRFVVLVGAVRLIYFNLRDEPMGRLRGEATSLNTRTWERETEQVSCEFLTKRAW